MEGGSSASEYVTSQTLSPRLYKPMASAKMSLNLKVEFGGGLELLFSNQRMHNITVPSTFKRQQKDQDSSLSSQEESPVSVTYLLHWLKDNVLKEREELFLEEDTVCVLLF